MEESIGHHCNHSCRQPARTRIDLAQMLFGVLEGKPVNQAKLDARVHEAIGDVVARQLKVGIDVISDGEQGKVGFSNYRTSENVGLRRSALISFMAARFGRRRSGVIMEALGGDPANACACRC